LLETCRGFKKTYCRRNCASSWSPTRIIRRCTVRTVLKRCNKKRKSQLLMWAGFECRYAKNRRQMNKQRKYVLVGLVL